MSKIFRQVSFLVVCVLCASATTHAGSLDSGHNDRRGFFIGTSLGAGMMNLNGSGSNQTKFSLIGDEKIGGAINEKLLIMYNGSISYARISGVNFTIYTFPVAVQYFFYKDFFARAGAGIALARATTSVGGVGLTANSKTSFGADLAGGYEFRFGKYFALSPELVYHYVRIRSNLASGNANVFGAQASAVWYF